MVDHECIDEGQGVNQQIGEDGNNTQDPDNANFGNYISAIIFINVDNIDKEYKRYANNLGRVWNNDNGHTDDSAIYDYTSINCLINDYDTGNRFEYKNFMETQIFIVAIGIIDFFEEDFEGYECDCDNVDQTDF